LPALIPRLVLTGVLAAAFVAFTAFVASGGMGSTDRQVLNAMNSIWQPALHVPMQAIALLGGLELTTLVTLGLGVHLWRAGFRSDLLALLALPVAVGLEILYKILLYHPAVPVALAHSDGPSLSDLLESARPGNSYPSGHLVRAVVAYGLLGFVVYRLARRRWVKVGALVATAILLILMAFDRLYLDVHWESDVIGALLLGAVCLLAATLWLDRPHSA
jgi:undecaprenyl-diphosphatase